MARSRYNSFCKMFLRIYLVLNTSDILGTSTLFTSSEIVFTRMEKTVQDEVECLKQNEMVYVVIQIYVQFF